MSPPHEISLAGGLLCGARAGPGSSRPRYAPAASHLSYTGVTCLAAL
jgi:hypothetical protein